MYLTNGYRLSCPSKLFLIPLIVQTSVFLILGTAIYFIHAHRSLSKLSWNSSISTVSYNSTFLISSKISQSHGVRISCPRVPFSLSEIFVKVTKLVSYASRAKMTLDLFIVVILILSLLSALSSIVLTASFLNKFHSNASSGSWETIPGSITTDRKFRTFSRSGA